MSAQTYFIERARRHLRLLTTVPAPPSPCPIPSPTEEQAHRVALYQRFNQARRADRRTLYWLPFPLFDDEPSQRCGAERCHARV